MGNGKIERPVAAIAFATLALIVAIESFGLSRAYASSTIAYREPSTVAISVMAHRLP